MKTVLVAMLLLLCACGDYFGSEDHTVTTPYRSIGPLTPDPNYQPPPAPVPWSDVPPEGELSGPQAIQACKDVCTGATDVEFYAHSYECECTCPTASVKGHFWQRKYVDEFAELWAKVCPK